MKQITAKYNSICSETGNRITKGQPMIYNYTTKKCYSMNSKTAKNLFSQDECLGMIQANEDAYFDNFCQNNNI